MTTLIDTVKPTETYLTTILPQALNGRDEAAYVDSWMKGLADVMNANPEIYRAYGPWWPALKAMMIARGNVSFGQTVDSDVASIYRMSRPALTLLAAYLYMNERLENEGVFNAVHILEVASYADDTEPYIYTSYDESIEKYRIRGSNAQE